MTSQICRTTLISAQHFQSGTSPFHFFFFLHSSQRHIIHVPGISVPLQVLKVLLLVGVRLDVQRGARQPCCGEEGVMGRLKRVRAKHEIVLKGGGDWG